MVDIAAGLSYAFERGICHRDLKMSNVLVSSVGQAMLLDFGLAAAENDDAANSPNPRTIDYAGLERATGVRKDDQRSDIYFLGCIFYHMLTGKPPIVETARPHTAIEQEPLRRRRRHSGSRPGNSPADRHRGQPCHGAQPFRCATSRRVKCSPT